ncbi:MAG TPA: hypothetical protein VM577_20325, partial [Anaerovoracaceae bacterium]|nr:hypothetical protein [Anaerovoracaceae bacterium]
YEYEDPGCWRPTIRISGEGCEFFLHTYEDCELLASSLEAHLQVCELIKLDKLEYQKLQDIQANPTSKPAKARKL